jgi:hypothetical protein
MIDREEILIKAVADLSEVIKGCQESIQNLNDACWILKDKVQVLESRSDMQKKVLTSINQGAFNMKSLIIALGLMAVTTCAYAYQTEDWAGIIVDSDSNYQTFDSNGILVNAND